MAASADTAAGSKERANNAILHASIKRPKIASGRAVARFDPAALLLPAAAQRLIELDKRKPFIQLRVDQVQLSREIVRLIRQNLQVTCTTIPIEDQGEAIRPFRCLSKQFLLLAELAILVIRDKRIRYLSER